MHPKNLKIEDFTYHLPDKNIAYHPTNPRDSSKLLVYSKGQVTENVYKNLADLLPDNSVLVFNDTKVINSRIFFQRPTGSTIEVFCLEPYLKDLSFEECFLQKGKALWICLVGKVSKWKEPKLYKNVTVGNQIVALEVELLQKIDDAYLIQFSWSDLEITFGEIIQNAGITPLPPYIKRIADETDEATYQTVYSENEGSVAAPTAGLHFTKNIFNKLKEKGISSLYTTLHVGAGTFMPVKSESMGGHLMHAEMMCISIDFLNQLIPQLDGLVISVGTTSTRTLESIYWMGNKILNNSHIEIQDLKITQWQPYEGIPRFAAQEAVLALKNWILKKGWKELSIETQIIIAPGYQFGIVKGLITNFHQPQSTLLLLVSALIGDEWKRLYQYALAHDFRFLSYGDGNLLLP
jgi:S-adenosylmethionine:tRNA ribosyltransferase-isomerase